MRNPLNWLRLLTVMVLVSLIVGACGGGGGDTGSSGGGDGDFKAAIVTDTAGLGDQSFNDSANRGLEKAGAGPGHRELRCTRPLSPLTMNQVWPKPHHRGVTSPLPLVS